MTAPAEIVARARARGANLVLEPHGLRIVNGAKLSGEAKGFITKHKAAIVEFLREAEAETEERAAIIEFDGGGPREWAEQFAKLLIQSRPAGIDDLDWTQFIVTCGRIIDEAPGRAT